MKKFIAILLVLALITGFGCTPSPKKTTEGPSGPEVSGSLVVSEDAPEKADETPKDADVPKTNAALEEGGATEPSEPARAVTKVEYIPIVINGDGAVFDQNGIQITRAQATAFFEKHQAYARTFVAVNDLCTDLVGDVREDFLDSTYRDAFASDGHVEGECLSYNWLLYELPEGYDEHLEELKDLTEGYWLHFDSADYDTALRVLLGKLIEFRDDGTYEFIITAKRPKLARPWPIPIEMVGPPRYKDPIDPPTSYAGNRNEGNVRVPD